MIQEQNEFGQLLQQARESAGLSRAALAERVSMDASHIYRMETGDRRPSRDAVLLLGDALGLDNETLNKLLTSAGYAPVPLLNIVRAAVRTRGGGVKSRSGGKPLSLPDWAASLDAMGLQETTIGHILRLMEKMGVMERKEVAGRVRGTFSHVTEVLEAPIHTAVIPVAGGNHRLLATHVVQRLLLSAIGEAVESGISKIILILAPGSVESLYMPLKEALDLAIVPSVKLHYYEQSNPNGLGDAILYAEAGVDQKPFAVLLPDDVVRERIGRAYSRELRRMISAYKQLNGDSLMAITPVPKSKMPHCGVVKVGTKRIHPNLLPVIKLVEKPEPSDPVCRSSNSFGIVGRYLLQPTIFHPLRKLKEKRQFPLHLTDALEQLRLEGHSIYAFELGATRQDIGEILEQASELIGDSSV